MAKKLNTKKLELKNLEERLKKDINSELPVKDKKFKEFLYNMIKGYNSIKEAIYSIEEAENGIMSGQSDIHHILSYYGHPIENYDEFGYAVGQLIKFSVLYEYLTNKV